MKNTREKVKKYQILCFLSAAGLLAGCSGSGSNLSEGMRQVQALNYAEALASFDAAEEAGENSRLIARGRGIAYMGLTDYEQAIAGFLEALGGSNGFVQSVDFDLNYYLAAAYLKNGQNAEAEAVYDAILALRPDEEEAYFLRGNARLARANYDGAREDFDRVIAMDAENYDRLIAIHEALVYYGYREAGQEYLSSAMLASGDKMSNYDIGRIYYYLGEYQQASMALEKAKEKGNEQVYLYLGKSYEATGDYNYASSVYNMWVAKDTGCAEIYNQLGLCEMAKGDYRKALAAFQAGMQIEDNDFMQALSFNEIVAYEHLTEYRKAATLLEGYLKSYPDDETAKREQVFLSTR